MDEMIETNKNKIKCWIYGHTHIPSNKFHFYVIHLVIQIKIVF